MYKRQQWGDIAEGSGGESGAATAAKTVTAAPPARPAYPSSKAAQKKTVTDWDKLEAELDAEEEEAPSGDAARSRRPRTHHGLGTRRRARG